jgi:hypothetical protein
MTSFNHTRFMAGIVMRTQPWLAASAEPAHRAVAPTTWGRDQVLPRPR